MGKQAVEVSLRHILPVFFKRYKKKGKMKATKLLINLFPSVICYFLLNITFTSVVIWCFLLRSLSRNQHKFYIFLLRAYIKWCDIISPDLYIGSNFIPKSNSVKTLRYWIVRVVAQLYIYKLLFYILLFYHSFILFISSSSHLWLRLH